MITVNMKDTDGGNFIANFTAQEASNLQAAVVGVPVQLDDGSAELDADGMLTITRSDGRRVYLNYLQLLKQL